MERNGIIVQNKKHIPPKEDYSSNLTFKVKKRNSTIYRKYRKVKYKGIIKKD